MTTPQTLVEHALEESTADHCIVILTISSTANLRWANNTLTTNGIATREHLTVVSVVDGADGVRAGVLTRTATTNAQVKALVAAADEAARRGETGRRRPSPRRKDRHRGVGPACGPDDDRRLH